MMHVLYIHAQQGMATPPYPLYHLKRQLIKKCELIKKQFKIEQFNIGKADHSTFKTQHPKFMLLCSPPQYRSALKPSLGRGNIFYTNYIRSSLTHLLAGKSSCFRYVQVSFW